MIHSALDHLADTFDHLGQRSDLLVLILHNPADILHLKIEELEYMLRVPVRLLLVVKLLCDVIRNKSVQFLQELLFPFEFLRVNSVIFLSFLAHFFHELEYLHALLFFGFV